MSTLKDFFDRKTFDPVNNKTDQSTLNILRQAGKKRLRSALNGIRNNSVQSTALRWALESGKNSGAFLDLGCGDSPDSLVAEGIGFDVNGIDLFPSSEPLLSVTIGDVVEHIPHTDESIDIAISQAMLDLIEPSERLRFFKEVDRVLKPNGVFACNIVWLQTGYGFDLAEERERALQVWPAIIKKPTGFIVKKGETK